MTGGLNQVICVSAPLLRRFRSSNRCSTSSYMCGLLFNSLCVNALFVWRVASGQVTGALHQVVYVCVSANSLCVNAPLCASGQILHLQLCLCFYELPCVKSLQVKWIKFQLSATNVVKFNKSNVLLEIMAQCMGND